MNMANPVACSVVANVKTVPLPLRAPASNYYAGPIRGSNKPSFEAGMICTPAPDLAFSIHLRISRTLLLCTWKAHSATGAFSGHGETSTCAGANSAQGPLSEGAKGSQAFEGETRCVYTIERLQRVMHIYRLGYLTD